MYLENNQQVQTHFRTSERDHGALGSMYMHFNVKGIKLWNYLQGEICVNFDICPLVDIEYQHCVTEVIYGYARIRKNDKC